MTCKECSYFESLKPVSKVSETGKCMVEPLVVIVGDKRSSCRHFKEKSDEYNDILVESV